MAESELDEVARFLRTVFGVGESHRMFQTDVLRWKCIVPHPFWEGSRGYALRYKGEIAAFGCVVPCRFLTEAGAVDSCNVIDWAASKAVPSAGILLYRHIQGLAGTMINIGGTEEARRVLPQIGFQARAEMHHYTRVLRPWRHFEDEPKDWKSPARLVRDYREVSRPVKATAMLTAQRVKGLDGMFPDPSVTGGAVCARTRDLVDYFLACPAARMEAHVLACQGVAAGYFLLSRVGAECRIADLWINSPDRQDWADAYAVATAAAAKDAQTTVVTLAASMAPPGYRRTHSEPVFVLDPKGVLAGRDLSVGFLENDAFYWSPNPASDRAK